MPGFLVHSLISIILAASLGLFFKLPLSKLIVLILISVFASLFPDIDIKTSIFRISLEKVIAMLSCGLLILFLILNIKELILVTLIMQIFLCALYFIKHRGIFHNPFVAVVLFVVFYLPFKELLFGIAASLSFILHIFIDKLIK